VVTTVGFSVIVKELSQNSSWEVAILVKENYPCSFSVLITESFTIFSFVFSFFFILFSILHST